MTVDRQFAGQQAYRVLPFEASQIRLVHEVTQYALQALRQRAGDFLTEGGDVGGDCVHQRVLTTKTRRKDLGDCATVGFDLIGQRAEGIGVLITDHDVRETLDIVDRAYILHTRRDRRLCRRGGVYLGDRFSL